MFFSREGRHPSRRMYARALFVIVLLVGILSACSTTNEPSADNPTSDQDTDLVATITTLVEQRVATIESTSSARTSDIQAAQATSCITVPHDFSGSAELFNTNYEFYLGLTSQNAYDMGQQYISGTRAFQQSLRLESGGKGILALGYRKSNGELQLEHVEQYEAVGGSRSFSESLDMFIVPEEMQILYALFFANGSATSDLSFACEPQIDRVESAPPEPGPSRLWTVDIYGENFTKTQFLRADGSVASVPNVHLISPEGRRFTKDSAENYQVIYESSKHVRVLSPIDISGQWNLEFYYHDGKSVKALIDNFVVSDEVIPFSTGFELPVRPVENEAWVIKGFYGGPNPTSYSGVQHLGEDWNWRSGNQDCGKSIYASSNGKVVLAEYRGAWGGVVVLRHNIRSTGSLFETIYAHMAPADGIAVGSFVERGDLVGTLYDYDGSGPSVCHLHFEARDESIQRKSNTAGWWGSTSGTGYYTATGDNPWPPQGFHEPSEWIRNHSP